MFELDADRPVVFSEVVERLAAALRQSGSDAVEVRRGGQVIGFATRERVSRWSGTLAGTETAPVSSGDQATLPGESGQYRALRYACPEPHQPIYEEFRIFHDARYGPHCPVHDKAMELRGWI
ncbi:hypothetical protein AB0K25_19685 [Micromonospora sp. NPDC049257]|uniref:hypothetical protein n=1 Tax=Micromonospora sp. NPDC049257 TaxID=3155771 RepID=UPI003428CA8A